MQNTSRTIIYAIVFGLLLLAYEYFVVVPVENRHRLEAERAQAAQKAQAPAATPGVAILTRAQALETGPRVPIATPKLSGSVSLTGARIDDLSLCGAGAKPGDPSCYRQTTQAGSPPVTLLAPYGTKSAYLAFNGWRGANLAGLPDGTTPWTQTSQGPLSVGHPLDLAYTSPGGLVFHREIAVDDNYLFTVTDQVQNTGTAPAEITPFGTVLRTGVLPDAGKAAMEGAVGMFNGELKQFKFPKWKKDGEEASGLTSTGGWMGITDKYWMTVFVPAQAEAMQADFKVNSDAGGDTYQGSFTGAPRVVAPGGTTSEVTHLFAGAKVESTLEGYSKSLGTPRLEDGIDWGIFSLIDKPLFQFLEILKSGLGSFALAILALTVVIRVCFFPLYNASYAMTTKMKKIQPEMKAMQERLKGDPAQQQKEMLALYQREKINPVTGCIPALLPIPVMIALVNLFNSTIEMRHAPFFGWISDMSAPDPTNIWNLFGAIPWNPAALPLIGGVIGGAGLLAVGAWPLIYAVTLWLSMSMAPPSPGMDPTQQRIMQWMPLMFTFFLAHSSVGLVIYWAWSSVFTIIQQYVLMRRFKVENPIDDFFARFGGPKAEAEAG